MDNKLLGLFENNLSRLPDGFSHALQEKGENWRFLPTKHNSKKFKILQHPVFE
jgi:hypothetical protein